MQAAQYAGLRRLGSATRRAREFFAQSVEGTLDSRPILDGALLARGDRDDHLTPAGAAQGLDAPLQFLLVAVKVGRRIKSAVTNFRSSGLTNTK
jgi:hypothetical protein